MRNFTNVVKPTHRCNLACAYCYNEDERAPVMTRDTLQNVLAKTCSFARHSETPVQLDFIWHGGEPLLAGLEFFYEAAALLRTHGDGLPVHNTIQTNGTLLNDAWITFIKAEGFRVSLSIDGPEALNDATRHNVAGKGSFRQILRGINLLREAKIPFGVAVVISKANRDHVEEIYDFLAAQGLPFNVIPLTRSGDALANYHDLGLDADEYAQPWMQMFDRWLASPEDHYVYSSDFAFKTRAIMLGAPQDCIAQANCSRWHVSTDPDGFVYPCATLSGDRRWSYGSLNEQTVAELLASAPAREALSRTEDPQCTACKWKHVCHGGCMQRAYKFFGTIHTRDYYCPSLYQIYEHIAARLEAHGVPVVRRNLQAPEQASEARPLSDRVVRHAVRGKLLPMFREPLSGTPHTNCH